MKKLYTQPATHMLHGLKWVQRVPTPSARDTFRWCVHINKEEHMVIHTTIRAIGSHIVASDLKQAGNTSETKHSRFAFNKCKMHAKATLKNANANCWIGSAARPPVSAVPRLKR